MKCLRGRCIIKLYPPSHVRQSGLIILARKDVSARGLVLSVGGDSMNVKGKPIKAPCKCGDIVHFKKYKPMYFDMTPTDSF